MYIAYGSVFCIISLFPYCFILKPIYSTTSLLQPNIEVEKGDIEVFYIGVLKYKDRSYMVTYCRHIVDMLLSCRYYISD